MNQYDKNNFEFLIKSTPAQLTIWWAQTDNDDRTYAFQLLEQGRLDLVDRAVILSDLTESKKVLSSYLLR
jgi:hypothetical protein